MINENGYGFAELARNGLNYIPKSSSLSWLREYLENYVPYNDVFPYKRLLKDSLFYPACACDMRPINALEKRFSSFVYADAYIEKETVYQHFLSMRYENQSIDDMDFNDYFKDNIKDYVPFYARELNLSDFGFDRYYPPLLPSRVLNSDDNDEQLNMLHESYIIWILLESRKSYYGKKKIISVLFFGGEMSAVYQCLYSENDLVPNALMFYNPGFGFWDELQDPYRIGPFFSYVLRGNNKGMPKFYISKEWNNYGNRNETLEEYEDILDCKLLKGERRYISRRLNRNNDE